MAKQKRRFFRRGKQQQPKGNYAFIDSQNLNLGTQRVGWKMNWKRFREWLRDEHGVVKAFMFIGYVPDNEDLYRQMKEAGYLVILKPTVDMYMTKEELKDEKHVTKGNADAELVLYAMKELQNYNKAIVVSGDGDFHCLVEYLDSIQKLKSVMAPNNHYSTLYRDYEQYIHVLDKDRKILSYGPARRKRSHNNSKKSHKK